jgi:hypothetical protein
MNTATTLMQPTTRLADASIESLAVAHYEQVFALCHALYADPSVCMSIANQAFRAAAEQPELVTVCRNAVHLLARRPGLELPVPSHALLSNLAWLLKEAVNLRYAEIAVALDMDVEQVKHEIAAVRDTLLSLVSEQTAA